jgi:Arc/MetJ-type ribon-helix-helix transcriptional regulator
MTTRQRLSASIDPDLLLQATEAVSRGDAPNLSAWVNDAIRLKLEHDRRMAALDELIAAHEKRHGVISAREVAEASRWARARAVTVSGRRRRTG